MQGDILFYSGNGLWDKIIQAWTHSKYNHVAIDMGDGTKIEALNNGVVRDYYLPRTEAAKWNLQQHSTDLDIQDLAEAVKWLEEMVGRKYGWSDIASASWLWRNFIYLVRPNYYDCSALATQFLIKCGGVDLGELGLDPHLATPASLAKQLGVS